MLNEQQQQLDSILKEIARMLDITPTDYNRAVASYDAVRQCLIDGYADGAYPGSVQEPDIYPQGSISLGTVVRPLPLQDDKDADFDVDLVCELQLPYVARTSSHNASAIKHQVGNRLQADGTYKDKMEDEGRRCWTLNYAKSAGVGFHLDILPCVPDPNKGTEITQKGITNPYLVPEYTKSTIGITHWPDKRSRDYEWKSSNPRGYAKWFKNRNTSFDAVSARQKQMILESLQVSLTQPIYNIVDDVPNELIRTPLQRAIQILKRHRDMRFKDHPTNKPISIIITTLSAWLYQGEQDVFTALLNIVNKFGHHTELLKNSHAILDESVADLELIKRKNNGEWLIPNTVDPDENFADRWHEENHVRAKEFFDWVNHVQKDIQESLASTDPAAIKQVLAESFGQRTLNEAWGKAVPTATASHGLIAGISRALSRFRVKHKQRPQWPINLRYHVTVTGKATRKGFRPVQFKSDTQPLNKHCSLRFEAKTTATWPYKVYWQVVNTDEEAIRADCLRGGYYDGVVEKGGRVREEKSLYTGMHWVECFIVKKGECVARSGEFVVNIQ